LFISWFRSTFTFLWHAALPKNLGVWKYGEVEPEHATRLMKRVDRAEKGVKGILQQLIQKKTYIVPALDLRSFKTDAHTNNMLQNINMYNYKN